MICIVCQESKDIDDFEFNKKKKVYRKMCHTCKNLQTMQTRYATKESHIRRKLSRLKERAKRLDYDFNLTYDDLLEQLEKQNGICFYTDQPLVFYAYKEIPSKKLAPSIDKIIPEKGYTKGNIVWCLNRINLIKNNMTLEEMKNWTPEWYRRIENEF